MPRLLLTFAFSLLLLAGCGGKNRPATYSVTGSVRYQNAAVAGAEVIFHPKNEQGKPARGRTNEAGEFSLRTYFSPTDDAAGAMAGDYTITVCKLEDRGQIVGDENFTPPKDLLPAKYAAAPQSPLSATVTTSGLNGRVLSLED